MTTIIPAYASQLPPLGGQEISPVFDYPEDDHRIRTRLIVVIIVLGVLVSATLIAGTAYTYSMFHTYSMFTEISRITTYDSADDKGEYVVSSFRISDTPLSRADVPSEVVRAQGATILAIRNALQSAPEADRVIVQGWLPVEDEYGVVTDMSVVNFTYFKKTLRDTSWDLVEKIEVWGMADAGTLLPTKSWAR